MACDFYDVIIVGAGIAGCGLAYNLKRNGYGGKVLVIDKKCIGANIGYGYRLTFENIVKEYDISVTTKYKGAKFFLGIDKEPLVIDEPAFSFDYSKLCRNLIEKSGYSFISENALKIKNKILITNEHNYRFKYLIDCSGSGFFLRKQLKFHIPLVYFIANIRCIKGNSNLDKRYYHILTQNDGFVEEVYFCGDKIIGGDWQITDKFRPNKPDYSLIKVPKKSFFNEEITNKKIIKSDFIFYPISPTGPLVHKNYAFLGDSFGNAQPSAGCGVEITLETSKMLSKAIKENNLKLFQNDWNKKYLDIHLKYMANKIKFQNNKRRLEVFEATRGYPRIMLKIFKNERIKLPKAIRDKISLNLKLRTYYYYLLLKLKYSLKII